MIVIYRLVDGERVFLTFKNEFPAGCSIRGQKKRKAKQNRELLKHREGFWLTQNWEAIMAQRNDIRPKTRADGA